MKTALLFVLLFAANVMAEPPTLPLPTSDVLVGGSLASHARNCKGLLVATLVFAGQANPGPPGCTDYDMSRWQVSKVLRGDYAADVRLGYRVATYPERVRQRPPEVGHKYILLSQPSTERYIADTYEYSDEKIQEIEQLMVSKPK